MKLLKKSAFLLDKLPIFYRDLIIDILTRLKDERIHITAGYLTYVTLMSLVPLMVVMFSIMTAFPLFSDVKDSFEGFVYQNFLPTRGDVIQEHLASFVENASKMSVIAVSLLFLFAFLLMSAIDKSLGHLWKIEKKRRFMVTFATYWLVLTLGPVLISISIALSSYIFSLLADTPANNMFVSQSFLVLLPFVVSLVAFQFLYVAVPNKRIPMKVAFFGAFFAALAFEIAKKVFSLYVLQLPSYQAIYGTLSLIPLLFLWMYLSWNIVLFGALLTVSLDNQQNKNLLLDEVIDNQS